MFVDVLHEEVQESDNCSPVVFVSLIGRLKSVYHPSNSKANLRVPWVPVENLSVGK